MGLSIAETRDIATCHALRRAVFIDEQQVPEADEMDDLDGVGIHLLAHIDGVAIGTARLLTKGDIGKIGRVCVLKSHRGTGVGAALIRFSLDLLATNPDLKTARLGAQTHAIPFYEGLGFTAHGPLYDDGGIPHRDMDRAL